MSREPPVVLELGEPPRPALVWPLAAEPMMAIASAPMGGGIGQRVWVVNAEVPSDYRRTDIELHLRELAESAGLRGSGVGFLTAAPVSRWTSGEDHGVSVYATVGLEHPTWAATPDDAEPVPGIGTINIVAFVPVRLSDTALVNAVMTVTEAKVQALVEQGVEGTGTASDAVCVLAPPRGPAEEFAGPRSAVGAPLARAVHTAVAKGGRAWSARRTGS